MGKDGKDGVLWEWLLLTMEIMKIAIGEAFTRSIS